MSRIGKKPVIIPANVTVNVAEGNVVTVKGPKGELTNTFNADMIINVEGNVLTVSRPTDEANHRALHGLTRTLIANMVEVLRRASPRPWKSTASATVPRRRATSWSCVWASPTRLS